MSDHFRGVDEDGAYKSRHSASQQNRRNPQSTASRAGQSAQSPQRSAGQRPGAARSTSSERNTAGQNGGSVRESGDSYIGASRRRSSYQSGNTGRAGGSVPGESRSTQGQRTTASQSGVRSNYERRSTAPQGNVSPRTGEVSKTNPSAARRPEERRSAVGRYHGESPAEKSRSGFRVNISEDDYYDSDATMQEINAAKSSNTAVRRRSASSENALVPAEVSPTTPKRIVTSSLGDTYQIQDDGVLAPRQLRSRQKFVRKKNRGCIVALVYSAAVCSISILLAYYMIVGVNDMFALVKKDPTDIIVDVPKGATLEDVTDLLDDNGVIEYPFFFKTYAKISKKNTGFKAGTFTLNTKSDYNQLLQKLRLPAGADKSTITVTIPEGLTVEQVAVLMEDNSVCEAENFMKTAREGEFTQKFFSNVNTKDRPYKVEGYLYPDTYNFYLSEGSVSAVNRLLGEFGKHWTDEYADKAKEIGMSMDEVIRLASVVEREASKTEDRYNVASVFVNRLKKKNSGTGGKLQSDATRWYPYATKKELLASDKLTQAEKDDWIENNLGVCDTYRLKGLPPCPICSPSIDSIEAVLYHDNTSYLYFCSDAEGNFYFAKTLKEHNTNLKKAGLA